MVDKSAHRSCLLTMDGRQIGLHNSNIVQRMVELINHARLKWSIKWIRDYQPWKYKKICLLLLGLVHTCRNWISWFFALKILYIYFFYYLFIIDFIYCPHVLIPRRGGRFASLVLTPFRVFSFASDRPFVIERQLCSLSTKPNVFNYAAYTITVCGNSTAHSQDCLPASVEAKELNLKYALATGELNPGPLAPAAKCITTRPTRPLIYPVI